MSQKIDPQAVYNLEMVLIIFLHLKTRSMCFAFRPTWLNDGSAACKESDPTYGGNTNSSSERLF